MLDCCYRVFERHGNTATFRPDQQRDKKPETAAEKSHALAFLRHDAEQIHRALQRCEEAWVHCTRGINRGPSGAMAYLLLYTDANLEQAQEAVGEARDRAKTTKNTFREQLAELAAGKKELSFPPSHKDVLLLDGGP